MQMGDTESGGVLVIRLCRNVAGHPSPLRSRTLFHAWPLFHPSLGLDRCLALMDRGRAGPMTYAVTKAIMGLGRIPVQGPPWGG